MRKEIKASFSSLLNRSQSFDSSEIRLSSSGIDPRCRLARIKGWYQPDFAGNEMIFLIGHLIEDAFLDAFEKETGYKVIRQAECIIRGICTGHLDAYLPEIDVVLELKTTQNLNLAPRMYNIFQVQSYLMPSDEYKVKYQKETVIQEWGTVDAKEAWIIYIDVGVNTLGCRLCRVKPHKATQKEIREVIAKIEKGREMESLPKDSFWEIDFKNYYTPMDFAFWLKNQESSEINQEMFSYGYPEVLARKQEEARKIGEEYLINKEAGKKEKISKNKKQLEQYFKEGITSIPCGDKCLVGSHKITMPSILKKAEKAGIVIPQDLLDIIKPKEEWKINIK